MAGENESGTARAQEGQAREENSSSPAPPVLGELTRSTYFVNLGLGPLNGDIPEEALAQVTRQYAIKGALFTLVGVVAILFPLLFGLAVEQLLAWLLVLGGGITLVQFVMVCGSPGTVSFLLLGTLHFAVGLWLLLRPIEGLAALTFVLSGWFLGNGILKLIMAVQLRHVSSWPAVLVSGIISIALGATIISLTPSYGLRLVGIVFGADFLSTGIAVLLISLMACCGRGSGSESDSEAAREPLLHGSGRAAAPSA